MKLDIVITGVGGQGTVLASRVLAQAALNAGFPAKTSETIGMAQREGTVQSHVRIGQANVGPVIGKQGADVLLGFEPAEAQRACGMLKPGGLMLVNLHPIYPVTVALGGSKYPEESIVEYLCARPVQTRFFDAFKLAVVAGNYRTVNTVMLGALARTGILPFPVDQVLDVLMEMVPARVREINQRAFELGSAALGEVGCDDK